MEYESPRICKEGGSYNSNLKRDFGITIEQYEEMVRLQGGICPVCRRPLGVSDKYHPVDHNHKTGKIRAVVHFNCNFSIGHFEDNPVLLRLAAEYLEKFGE